MRFNIADPHPDQILSEIVPLSARARSWLARANAGIDEDKSISTVGAVVILEGLDYHHTQFMKLAVLLKPYYLRLFRNIEFGQSPFPTTEETQALNALDHEAVAYLNRLGQFFAYAKASGFSTRLAKARELMVFRNKHTAHRSIDVPRGESTSEREYQAMAFGFYRLTRGGFPTYQLLSGKKHQEFHMERDHPTLMQEAVDELFALYPLPHDA